MSVARIPSASPLAGLVPAAAICSADSPRSTRSIRSCMVVAKSRISTDETSEIIPRPYWAAAPDSWISCATLTLVPRPQRSHPDGHPALVLLAAQVLGQFRAGQAGGDLGDVPEELPDLLDRLGHLEVIGD